MGHYWGKASHRIDWAARSKMEEERKMAISLI